MLEKWYSRKEACQILGVSMATLNRIMQRNEIVFYKTGTSRSCKTRFLASDLADYLKRTRN